MSAFNAFFAQLTGGGTPGGANSSSSAVGPDHGRSASAAEGGDGSGGVVDSATGGGGRGDVGKSGGGVGGASSSGGSELYGVPLNGTSVTYKPDGDRSIFGNPQVAEILGNLCRLSAAADCFGVEGWTG